MPPCRLIDTRTPAHAPALAANTVRTFSVGGLCGVPINAVAVALSITVAQETGIGNLRIFPAGGATPLASTINFKANTPRANNAVSSLGSSGAISVQCDMSGPADSTHFIADVYGYFL